MNIFSIIPWLRNSGRASSPMERGTKTTGHGAKTDITAQKYPGGVELEDYYLYYLHDPLRDSMAVRAAVIYITKRELLFEVKESDTLLLFSEDAQDNKETTGESSKALSVYKRSGLLFEVGKDISLKLQIPFRGDFIRVTGRIIAVEYDKKTLAAHIKVRYTKILGGDNEVLFDTILDMLMQ